MSRFMRTSTGLGLLPVSWLDFKVGFRMLARYPGLTAVGTAALAIAIALGAVYFEGVNTFLNPRLPIRDGDRAVTIRAWVAGESRPEARLLHDFAAWREQVSTVDDLGAAIVFMRNLETGDGRVEPVRGAEMTASGFRLMGTVPLLGRTFTEHDESAAQPLVAVIGYHVWARRYASHPGVVGRTLQIGASTATIVGVMPEGFGFPENERLWIPLRVDGSTLAARTGPAVSIFGRLAPGSTMSEVQAELDVIAARMAQASPETHRHLRPEVTTYGKPPLDRGEGLVLRSVMYAVNGIFLMLLAVIGVNVATLVFARTATRSWDITVRSALGASRACIVRQLFIEALVLAGVAAVLGLILARALLGWALSLAGSEGLPFWIDAGLSWQTVLYVCLLTLVGAAIVGVLPALRVTRVNVQDALRSESAAGAQLRFGGVWTTVIVVQVAFTVAFLPLAAGGVFESNRFRQRAEGIGADRYLAAGVAIDDEGIEADSTARAARARLRIDELERRLASEPGVERVAFADRLPVEDQFKYRIEADTDTAGDPAGALRTSTLVHVSDGFFAAFGTSVIAGRDFTPLDFETGRVLVVNESFARDVFGGRNAIGRRIRIVRGEVDSVAGEDWYEIVGMVRDFGWQLPRPEEQAAMYRPSLPLVGRASQMAVRVRDPELFGRRLRAIAFDVDPAIRLSDVQPLAQVGGGEARINWALTWMAWVISLVVLLLSASGIHALVSFTVAKRTREIGIRTALGAGRGRIVVGIFSRAFLQVGAGLLAGSGLVALTGVGSLRHLLLLLAANAIMLVAGLVACAVPLRRALGIDPTEALRAEA